MAFLTNRSSSILTRDLDSYADTHGHDQRQSGRIRQSSLLTNHGLVLDLSRSGMRLHASSALRGYLTVKMRTELGMLTLPCEVCWTRRLGFRNFEVGLRFINVNEAIRQHLMKVALTYSMARAA